MRARVLVPAAGQVGQRLQRRWLTREPSQRAIEGLGGRLVIAGVPCRLASSAVRSASAGRRRSSSSSIRRASGPRPVRSSSVTSRRPMPRSRGASACARRVASSAPSRSPSSSRTSPSRCHSAGPGSRASCSASSASVPRARATSRAACQCALAASRWRSGTRRNNSAQALRRLGRRRGVRRATAQASGPQDERQGRARAIGLQRGGGLPGTAGALEEIGHGLCGATVAAGPAARARRGARWPDPNPPRADRVAAGPTRPRSTSGAGRPGLAIERLSKAAAAPGSPAAPARAPGRPALPAKPATPEGRPRTRRPRRASPRTLRTCAYASWLA